MLLNFCFFASLMGKSRFYSFNLHLSEAEYLFIVFGICIDSFMNYLCVAFASFNNESLITQINLCLIFLPHLFFFKEKLQVRLKSPLNTILFLNVSPQNFVALKNHHLFMSPQIAWIVQLIGLSML